MPGGYAYEYRYVCACGREFETDNAELFDIVITAHQDCKSPETEALALLTRLVTAAERLELNVHALIGHLKQ